MAAPPAGAPVAVQAALAPGRHYTLAVVGPRASAEALLFEDDPSPGSGGVKLRLYHLSPDAPSVDLRYGDGVTAVGAVAYGEASPYASGLGAAKLQVLPAQVPAPVLASVSLGAGVVQSVFVLGELASLRIVTSDDIAVSGSVVPAMLPNTAGGKAAVGALAPLGLGLTLAGALLRRRARRARGL